MLACFFLTEQGCIRDLKRGVYLSKTNVTNRGSVPSGGIVVKSRSVRWPSGHVNLSPCKDYGNSGLRGRLRPSRLRRRCAIGLWLCSTTFCDTVHIAAVEKVYITKEWWFHANVSRVVGHNLKWRGEKLELTCLCLKGSW